MSLVIHQWRYDQRQFWREPASVFFTVVLPLIFLLLFNAIFGDDDIRIGKHFIDRSTYYVPGILALALVSATFVNLTIWLTIARDRGQLKRLRATPVPAWVVIAGRAMTAFVVALFMTVVVVGIGAIAFGVTVPTSTLPGALAGVLVGTLALSALGFAFASIVPSENAAPPMANAVVLPLYFISGVFVPADEIPKWMEDVASVFPVKPLFDALLEGFDPNTTGAGFDGGSLAILAAWGLVGAAFALRRFRWAPR